MELTFKITEEMMKESFQRALEGIVFETNGMTLNECVEKQILKKVNLYIDNDAVCPSCNQRLRGYEGMKIAYCKFCGQLIKGEGVGHERYM